MSEDAQRDNPGLAALASLRRFARPRPARERCELCDADLADEHAHMVELANRRLVCACDACALLFSSQAAPRYRRVPRDVWRLPDFRLPDETWVGLGLPIDLAFFLHSTAANRVVALYPSPGGAIEASVGEDPWQMLVGDNPILGQFEPDVEALLVNRLHGSRDCYRVGVDQCYKLVGLVRTHWRGLSGGTAVWGELGRFFAALKERSRA
jgi:hypothetical protein